MNSHFLLIVPRSVPWVEVETHTVVSKFTLFLWSFFSYLLHTFQLLLWYTNCWFFYSTGVNVTGCPVINNKYHEWNISALMGCSYCSCFWWSDKKIYLLRFIPVSLLRCAIIILVWETRLCGLQGFMMPHYFGIKWKLRVNTFYLCQF